MKHSPYLSIIVPVYNEEPNLHELYQRLKSSLENYNRSYEIIFIDDGSTDQSFSLLKDFYSQDEAICVIRFTRNFGQQMAISAGLHHARGDIVVLLDADLQTPPEEIPKLVDKIAEGYDIVYGIRERRADPLLRRIGSWCMSHLLYKITNIDIPDSASGFLALNRHLVDSINLFNQKSKYFSGLFAWLSYGRWAAVKVRHAPRRAGVSKYSIPKLISLTLNFVCSFTTLPLRLATYIGLFLFIAGIGLITILVILKLLHIIMTIAPFQVIVSILLILSGLQMISTGILGEYLARIYSEVQERPSYVIRELLDRQK